jgi:hypothetical protein
VTRVRLGGFWIADRRGCGSWVEHQVDLSYGYLGASLPLHAVALPSITQCLLLVVASLPRCLDRSLPSLSRTSSLRLSRMLVVRFPANLVRCRCCAGVRSDAGGGTAFADYSVYYRSKTLIGASKVSCYDHYVSGARADGKLSQCVLSTRS